MKWINFLHWYQPSNSDAYKIQEASDKSYRRLLRALKENPATHWTINVSACLFLRWEQLGDFDIISDLKKLSESGQVELTGSAAYHALLPLVPVREILLQIKEQEEVLKRLIGKSFKKQGFFLPEMAYSPTVAKLVKKCGYQWLILDEVAAKNKIDFSRIYRDRSSGLKIIFRSRDFSNSYVPDRIKDIVGEDRIVITATDGELYGLRHEDPTAELENILKNKKLQTETISEFIKKQPRVETASIRSCSWESSAKELKAGQPYFVWIDKKNALQVKLWDLAKLTLMAEKKYCQDSNYHWLRWHLVRGLASCTFWWASAKDFSHNFGPHAWNPDEIERGVNEFIRAIRSIENPNSLRLKIKAERLYVLIKQMIWEKHWNYFWKPKK